MMMTDEKLYELCKNYGKLTLEARWKFMGLLPEVCRRKLYEKKGYGDIFEFSAKLAGISREQVKLVVNLERSFEDKPLLKNLLVNGEVSVNKLARIASIASVQNQEFLANQLKILSTSALNTLVKDMQMPQDSCVNENEYRFLIAENSTTEFKKQNGLLETRYGEKSLYVHSNPQSNLEMSTCNTQTEMMCGHAEQQEFLSTTKDLVILAKLSAELKKKIIELIEKGIDINEVLLELLENREHEIEKEKEEISQEVKQKGPAKSRYIQVKIRKLIKKEHGTKCSIHNCNKPSAEIHHTQRFSLGRSHDPQFLAPLCREHHQIAHSIDLKFRDKKLEALLKPTNSL